MTLRLWPDEWWLDYEPMTSDEKAIVDRFIASNPDTSWALAKAQVDVRRRRHAANQRPSREDR
jgi:hypothetical protein